MPFKFNLQRYNKVLPAVNDFVESTMGRKFIEPPPFDLPGSYAESNATTPLLFVLSPGSDPTTALLKFAGDMVGLCTLNQVDP